MRLIQVKFKLGVKRKMGEESKRQNKSKNKQKKTPAKQAGQQTKKHISQYESKLISNS